MKLILEMILKLLYYLLSFITLCKGMCVNINNDHSTTIFNTTFNKKCYDYTLQEDTECCKNFIFTT